MSRVVQDIIDSAYARQKHAQQGIDANEDTELRPRLHDILGTFFGIGARVNPEFFSISDDVPWSGSVLGWPRPSNAEMVWWIENEGGERVVPVPRDDLDAEPGEPTVYRIGQVYKPTGGVAGPESDDTLTFTFVKKPDEIPELLSDIDELWPVGYEELLVLELAIYIALKDRRLDDAQHLVTERDRDLRRLIAHLEHETVGERRRKGHVRKFLTNTLVPVSSLLAGGSEVDL